MTRNSLSWQPSISIENLYRRAALLSEIRRFFEQRSVIEVDTPTLSRAAVTDPNIHSLSTELLMDAQDPDRLYLHTSPEFPMKRLLAAGAGAIYQICKVFRAGERGSRHNPEFTMLEWYRPGLDHHQLIDEIEELLAAVLQLPACKRVDYAELFCAATQLDPHSATLSQLQALVDAMDCGIPGAECETTNLCLDLIFSHLIAPSLGHTEPVFVLDYPVCQAALARIRHTEQSAVAERFELFINGMEIANGFHELSDSAEQRQRFEQDCAQRQQLGLPAVPMDEHLLSALQSGIPDCAGVALGIDRLLMVACQETDISKVISFPVERA